MWKWVVHALEVSQFEAIHTADLSGKYPMSSYFHFYLYARDSVSLSHFRINLEELKPWAETRNSAEGWRHLLVSHRRGCLIPTLRLR